MAASGWYAFKRDILELSPVQSPQPGHAECCQSTAAADVACSTRSEVPAFVEVALMERS